MQALSLGDLSATPWSVSPLWFALLAALLPALVWLAFAWRRALMECRNRVRRAGLKDMRKLMKNMRRSDAAPTPAHLHAWLRASARVWDVRSSAPSADEVARASHFLSGDEAVGARWRELYSTAEHGLYAPDAQLAPDWLDRAADAASGVEMPKRERMFPNRLGDWLPNRPASGRRPLLLARLGRSAVAIAIGALIVTTATPPVADADVPWSSPTESSAPPSATAADMSVADSDVANGGSMEQTPAAAEPLPPEVLLAAQAALDANWNDWAAHHNLAAFQTQEGDLSNAIAHATAAFAQHPDANTTRATLLAALGETHTVDPTIRRLTSGPWYSRIPAFLSAAAWQRLALIAALITAAGLITMIHAMYMHRPSQPTLPRPSKQPSLSFARALRSSLPLTPATLGRAAFGCGFIVLAIAVTNWSNYGPLNQPTAAILLQNANMSPVPTDLVPTEETSPVAAGTVVVTRRSFLGWQEILRGPEASGWVRSNAVMPLYAR